MEIKVLGLGHVKDNLTAEIVMQVLIEDNIDIQIEKVTGCKNIAAYGIFVTPSVVIDGEVKCIGRIPNKEEVRGWISNSKKQEAQYELVKLDLRIHRGLTIGA